eukprot:TRINITY_DN3919_c0_g1_i1.p1 TRINITY_DN3919_c0_g1~~TRINITY_DN3919_c0_g1_i1.p1  ORF type:complete len:278 (-),score=46.39 TRINITY_DN3919_c0_g1_i1:24-857(-)
MKLSKQYLQYLHIENQNLKNLAFLNTLIKTHLAVIPFNSVAVQLLLPDGHISLETEDLMEKILINNRGGYCFELNKLFYELLVELDYQVTPIMSRVMLSELSDYGFPGLTHRFSIVEFDGDRFLVDVGFGGNCPPQAINFEGITSTSSGDFCVREDNGHYLLSKAREDEWYTLYKFEIRDFHDSDFVIGNFYSYKHPEAVFVNTLLVTRVLDNEIISIRNNIFKRRIFDEDNIELLIESPEMLQRLLSQYLNMVLPIDDCLTIFEKVQKSVDKSDNN